MTKKNLQNNINQFDGKKDYCRRLGHDVPFQYCRTVANGIPCNKIADCWHQNFDIKAYLYDNYTEEEIAKILAPPQPKVATLVDLIEKAKKKKSTPAE